jgi:hypothetical protein
MISLFAGKLASVHYSQNAPSQSPFDGLSFAVSSFRPTQVCSGHTSCNRRNARHPVLVCAASGDCCSRGL